MSVKRDPRYGRWFFRTIVKFADGTKDRVFGTPGIPGPYHDLPNSKVGAQEAERRAIAAALAGKSIASGVRYAATEVPHKPKTIKEYALIFLDSYKPESKPAAHRDRRYSLEGHLLPVFGERTIESLRQPDVDAFVKAELARGCSRKTINNRLGVLSSLIRYSTGAKPNLRLKIAGKAAEVHAVDLADVDRLLDACDDARHRAIVLLACEAGLRCGEIRGAQWTDVRNGQITIRRALDKETGEVIAPKHDKVRTVPLSPRVTDALAALPRRGLWIVSRLDGDALNYYEVARAISKLYTRAKVTPPPAPLHCLRHTFGTVMARRVPLGVLRTLMGHESIETTMRYVDVSEADKRDAIASVFGDGRGSVVAASADSGRKAQ